MLTFYRISKQDPQLHCAEMAYSYYKVKTVCAICALVQKQSIKMKTSCLTAKQLQLKVYNSYL